MLASVFHLLYFRCMENFDDLEIVHQAHERAGATGAPHHEPQQFPQAENVKIACGTRKIWILLRLIEPRSGGRHTERRDGDELVQNHR